MKNILPPASAAPHPVTSMAGTGRMFMAGSWLPAVPKSVLVSVIHLYRQIISPAQVFFFGATGGCRFTPTCSQFALEAIHSHGAAYGTILAIKRICRCHPWGGCGHDPVPAADFRNHRSEARI